MKDKAADKFLSVQDVAETLSCTEQYVYGLIKEGNLSAIKIGPRALRISEKSLRLFIETRTVNPADYFAPPEDAPRRPAEAVERQQVARSKWMSRP